MTLNLSEYHKRFIADGDTKHIEEWTRKYGVSIPLSYINLVRIWYKLPLVREV